MRMICLHDRGRLESFLRQDTFLNLYSLGDLDDSFWPYTTWYGLVDGERVLAVALMYSGLTLPTLLCTGGPQHHAHQGRLLESLLGLLPGRFYCHLSCGLSEALERQYRLEVHGLYYKMGLTRPGQLPERAHLEAVVLSKADLPELQAFYAASYPGNWFEPQMLDTNQYCGLRVDGVLVSVAGVHVYSPVYKVAALGNVATAPAHRGKGWARDVTGQLCRRLLASVDHIGLNVKADNGAAIACYRSLGFEIVGSYEEFMASLAR
jgi:ribosomal protein S18 acetylase RimI-like enzyme